MTTFDYDVIVIGSGSGGLTVSIGLAAAGKKVALVEKGLIGGDCTNTGCVPSKAFIDLAKKYSQISSRKIEGTKSILEKVRTRRQIIQDEETPEKIEAYGMKVIQGFASFEDKNTVLINGLEDKITAKNIVIATGSHPIIYPIDGLDEKDLLTNENVFELDEDVKELVVIGGGYIGCELAESFANIGVKVTIIQRNTRLIPKEEEESSLLLKEIFEDKGINVFTDSLVEKVEGNKLVITNKNTKKCKEIKFDKVLVCLGRRPNINNLMLEKAGIEYSEKGIKVDKYNRTKSKNIFAIGDCVEGNPMFTHLANNEGRGVVRNIILPYIKSSMRKAVLPATLYTNIEISRIGKTEEELYKHYNEEDIISEIMYFDKNDRSVLTDDKLGFIKINFKRGTGKILGATIAGSNAGEMLPILTSAMQNKISAYKLSKQIYSYPTKSEVIKKLADSFVVKTLTNIKGEIKYFLKDNVLQIITGSIWLVIFVSYFYYKNSYNLTNLEIAKSVYGFVANSFWGPLIYIIIYTVRPLVFFPGTFMTFMSGAIFGVWGGFLYTMIGANLSATLAYILGKILGKKLIKPESTGLIVDLKNKVSDNAFISILMTRLLFFPFDVVNYISGILRVKWRGYILGTIIGIIPGSLIFIIAGASVENAGSFDFSEISIDLNMIIISIVLFVASLGLAKFLKKKGF